ncbi:hypoxic response protein 1 [Oxobacter pfennigii]|uniref:Hypoxic response protein 1 n=1 Tax=Oxobacter pfennigii TaxID=36849 RepID=A0A0P8YZJ4_9CLOT|nr:CBS domain-containing protein [Oxobacter pfennigii]KPU45294.1 hypoxic response protein 1 [Oxobacter pfennigii]
MELKSIMSKDVVAVSKDTSVDEAAQLMKQHDIGCIPVCENDKVIGMVTDRDIVIRGVANKSDDKGTTCEEIMSKDLVVGSVNMDVHEAAKIMADNQVRRLPVVENGKLVGMVALGDLAVEPDFINEAGDALNDISKPVHH